MIADQVFVFSTTLRSSWTQFVPTVVTGTRKQNTYLPIHPSAFSNHRSRPPKQQAMQPGHRQQPLASRDPRVEEFDQMHKPNQIPTRPHPSLGQYRLQNKLQPRFPRRNNSFHLDSAMGMMHCCSSVLEKMHLPDTWRHEIQTNNLLHTRTPKQQFPSIFLLFKLVPIARQLTVSRTILQSSTVTANISATPWCPKDNTKTISYWCLATLSLTTTW